MDSIPYAKIIKGLVAIGIVVVIWFPDLVWELLVELIHVLWELIFEALHLIFEAVEAALDTLIEQLLETDLRSTQLIVFYIILAVILVLVYRCSRWLRDSYRHWLDAWQARLQSFKAYVHRLFLQMGMGEKVKWLALVVLALITRILLGF